MQSSGQYYRQFHLTRNPIYTNGKQSSFIEEGRMHLDITLIFGIDGSVLQEDDEEKNKVAVSCYDVVSSMRVAGGSVIPSNIFLSNHKPVLFKIAEEGDERRIKQFRRLLYKFMPGFALVSRHDLLCHHLDELKKNKPNATLLDSLLDQSRFNWASTSEMDQATGKVVWRNSRTKGSGWIVPIPVGYRALSEIYPAGTVKNVRDNKTPFCFVESIYSLGEWISLHRLRYPEDFLWYSDYDSNQGVYQICNDYSFSQNKSN
jgi:CRISPR-associated protein Csy2